MPPPKKREGGKKGGKEEREIHIKREKESNTESHANDARSVEYVCSLPASFARILFLSILFESAFFIYLFLEHFYTFYSSASLLPSLILREETLLHARSRLKDGLPLTAYTNPSCLNSLANYFHSVSLFPCISRYQSVCAPRHRLYRQSCGFRH